MTAWQVSAALETFLKQTLSEIPPVGFPYYPCIGWTLGGSGGKPGGKQVAFPPAYALGLIPRDNLDKYQAVHSRAFRFIAFSPKPEDATSPRRLIDFDGKNIIVR